MKSNMKHMIKKELREVFRDKKSLSMMLIIPIMIPLLILGMSALFDMQTQRDVSEYNKIGFAYELSDTEKELAKQMKLDVTYGSKEELEKAYQNEEIYLYVTKEDDVYTMNYDTEADNGSMVAKLVETYFTSYERILQEQKLTQASQDPSEVLDVFELKTHNLGTENFFASYIVGYAFLFIIMAITISATYPATDTTAGEKERGTLETLLTFPIKSRDIIIGKLCSVTISSIVTGILSLILALISFHFANDMFTIYKDVPIELSGLVIFMSIVVIIIYSIFISGLCLAIASMSKTFKEAQSALTPLTFISFFPGMIAFMIQVKTSELLAIVPFMNFTLIINDLGSGIVNYLQIFLMILSSLIYIGIVIWYIIRQYKSEKVLFSI